MEPPDGTEKKVRLTPGCKGYCKKMSKVWWWLESCHVSISVINAAASV